MVQGRKGFRKALSTIERRIPKKICGRKMELYTKISYGNRLHYFSNCNPFYNKLLVGKIAGRNENVFPSFVFSASIIYWHLPMEARKMGKTC